MKIGCKLIAGCFDPIALRNAGPDHDGSFDFFELDLSPQIVGRSAR